MVDEAHALGVQGQHGAGCLSKFGIPADDVITINPCGKGMGASGAFITGPHDLRDYLINTSREFIFNTAPSPSWLRPY